MVKSRQSKPTENLGAASHRGIYCGLQFGELVSLIN